MPPIQILLVDDDEDDFILTRGLLSACSARSYHISWNTDYLSSLNSMLKNEYDIYLVDYRLGRQSGIELLNEAIKSGCSRPIIVLTGKGDERIDEEAMRSGAADYLVKDEISSLTLERSIRYAVQHHKTLQKLKASENKFRIIFERSKDPMFITDFQGRIHDANSSALCFFELTREEFLRRNAADFYKNKSNRTIFVNSIEKTGSVTDLEFELLTARGSQKYCRVSSFMQISHHGDQQLYYTILHDLTNRKLEEQEKVLEEKLSAIERIARNMADEIYNPLSNINLAIDELKNSLGRQDELLLVDIIKKNCQTINHLSSELIESTQVSALDIRKIDLTNLLNSTFLDCSSLYNVEIALPNPARKVFLYGDENKLKFALSNILQNAAEALKEDRRIITVDFRISSPDIILTIADRGAGIEKENLNKIFEPFFSTKPRSIGLGLTQSQRIIRAHDGKLDVKSRPGDGTVVTITLPLIKN